tara:strand:- start:2931 stop:3470 length:540 start_codon:yes stop_codon:yes gene_type:complete
LRTCSLPGRHRHRHRPARRQLRCVVCRHPPENSRSVVTGNEVDHVCQLGTQDGGVSGSDGLCGGLTPLLGLGSSGIGIGLGGGDDGIDVLAAPHLGTGSLLGDGGVGHLGTGSLPGGDAVGHHAVGHHAVGLTNPLQGLIDAGADAVAAAGLDATVATGGGDGDGGVVVVHGCAVQVLI